MQLNRELERSVLRKIIKKVLIANLLVLLTVVFVQAEVPVTNVSDVQKELLSLEVKLEKAIQEIDKSEKEFVKEHLQLCAEIETRLKNAEEKKRGFRLSKKEKSKLVKKLNMEYQSINMIQQLNNLARETKKKDFEKLLYH